MGKGATELSAALEIHIRVCSLKDPEFVAKAEKTRMTLNQSRVHPAQHDRRRPVHRGGAQRKSQADSRAQGLAGESA
jgi:hypothetical protein